MNKVAEASNRKGLSINIKKMECMVIGLSKKIGPKCELDLDVSEIMQVEIFFYLDSLITENDICDNEIKRRIELAKDAFQKSENILLNRKLSMEIKKRILDC